jgi:hypothetical protein
MSDQAQSPARLSTTPSLTTGPRPARRFGVPAAAWIARQTRHDARRAVNGGTVGRQPVRADVRAVAGRFRSIFAFGRMGA